MDRSWVLGRLFSREYISGVKNFMSFIQRKFSEDDEILCPCSRCLNQKSWHQGLVEKHLLVNGMESTYTRWIHHGENFDVDVVENPNDHHVENLGGEYNDHEPDALELFKECHYSKKKKSYSSAVQVAITEMENKLSTLTEGEQHKSATEVVADVLAKNTKKNQFLHNVGIQNARPRSKVQDIEAQLEEEKRANAELLSIVNNQREQLDVLSKQVQETEQTRIKEQEEMKKMQDEMNAKLELLLSQI